MNEDDLLDAIGDAIRDSTIRLGDQESVDERRAARAILAIPEIAAGLAALRIARTGPGIAITSNGDVWGDQAFMAGTSSHRSRYGKSPADAVLALDAKLGGVS